MSERVYVSEAESVELMMRSGYQPDGTLRAVQMHFGPRWAALDESAPDYSWALEQLAELRGITLDEPGDYRQETDRHD